MEAFLLDLPFVNVLYTDVVDRFYFISIVIIFEAGILPDSLN